jgi:hypothetical protein
MDPELIRDIGLEDVVDGYLGYTVDPLRQRPLPPGLPAPSHRAFFFWHIICSSTRDSAATIG